MKKHLFPLFAFLLAVGTLQANPVPQEVAKAYALSFVTSQFEIARQSTSLDLVYTAHSERGEATFYVFNVGATGFVVMSADDHSRPVLGYSDEGVFNPDDMAPALSDFLQAMSQGIAYRSQQNTASAKVMADWKMMERTGSLVSRNGGREAEYLVETKWNQNYPYNYFCPLDEAGPGGHAYAGCVATAAAQLVRYWSHPLQGSGQRCYTHETYGQLCANFGETTYDWANMPISISANSPQEQIEAIALLHYHIGVAMEMGYGPSGSGAVTNYLCERMPEYFGYSNQMVVRKREDLEHDVLVGYMKDQIDMAWPLVCAGGGHAYVCDGYDDFDMIHFNWGWSGSSDGWFDIDEHGYIDGYRGLFNYVPAEHYAATATAPINVIVTPAENHALSATVEWTNPTLNLGNTNLTSIDKIVVERNGQVIYSEDNVAPGATMSIIDNSIPCFDAYKYTIYAICNGQRGKSAVLEGAAIGPSCDWKIVMQSNSFHGWYGGYVSLYNAAGTEMQRFTLTSSTPNTITFPAPVGNISFGWTAANGNVTSIAMNIKNANNQSVYTYQGGALDMEEGIFLEYNNDCGNGGICAAPFNLRSTTENDVAILTWECEETPYYGYNIYRDGRLYALVAEGNTLTDEISAGHCYTVTALCENGESEQSNETCASSGDCMAPHNLDVEFTSSFKVKLLWERPEVSEGLSGYYIFRKPEGGEYERIKLAGASATSHTDNGLNQEGHYYYRIYAYYGDIDCTSAPASLKNDPNVFYLHVYYSPTGVEEFDNMKFEMYPNPADQTLHIQAEGMIHVAVCNMLGQKVFEKACDSDDYVISTASFTEGIYMVTISTKEGDSATRRIAVTH